MTVPVPKPPVFEGNTLEYLKWENAFDALIEDQLVQPNYKLYYLGEWTCAAAQKTISGLLGLQTEDTYKRARKTGEYASLVSAKATRHDTAKRKLNAMSVRSHMQLFFIVMHLEESTQETVRATNNCMNCSDTTTSMILLVWIHHKEDPEHRVKVYAVLDDQSDT